MSVHNPIHPPQHVVGEVASFSLLFPFLIGTLLYFICVVNSNRRYKSWPISRTVFWILGVSCTSLAVAGPLAERSYVDFTAHMIGHLLLGMLGPLLMVLGAPMTLLMRTLNVKTSRQLSKLLKSKPFQLVTDPIIATLLNVGGLWLLYTTDLWNSMHENTIVHVLIHFHVFLAGFVFTQSIITIDPTPHRTSYLYRSIILVLALAAHAILSKYMYANPPYGILVSHAETGAMFMYYGGDVIDSILIFILCRQWYKARRPCLSSKSVVNPTG